MTQRKSDGPHTHAQLRLLTRKLKVMLPIEDNGSFASLLAALDSAGSQPQRKRRAKP